MHGSYFKILPVQLPPTATDPGAHFVQTPGASHVTQLGSLEQSAAIIDIKHPWDCNTFLIIDPLVVIGSNEIIRLYFAKIQITSNPIPFPWWGGKVHSEYNMLDAGIIQPSFSDWTSPVCLERKRCGGVRVCTDNQGLNHTCVKDAFPLPRIHDCLDTLSGKEWFSNIDMASGYYQVEVENEDRYLTAFITKYGLFYYARMPFGLSNEPATFQSVVHLVLAG